MCEPTHWLLDYRSAHPEATDEEIIAMEREYYNALARYSSWLIVIIVPICAFVLSAFPPTV